MDFSVCHMNRSPCTERRSPKCGTEYHSSPKYQRFKYNYKNSNYKECLISNEVSPPDCHVPHGP